MRLLRAAELSQVNQRAYFGQLSLCLAPCVPSRSWRRRPTQKICRARTLLPIFNSFTPLSPAPSYLMLVLPNCFCDPISTSCLSCATRGSQVLRGKRKSLSLRPPKLFLQKPSGLHNKHLISFGKQ